MTAKIHISPLLLFVKYEKKLPLNIKKIKTQDNMSTPKRVFIGSAQADAPHVDTLKKHLKLYERQNLIQIWDESMLIPGEIRNSRIEQELHTAEIILLLFSADLLAEEFIWGAEMNKILEKVKRKAVQLIPILLRPSSFADTPFAAYAAVPQRDKPISSYTSKDEAWTIVVEQIKRSIQSIATSLPPDTNTNSNPKIAMIPQSLIDGVNNLIINGNSDKALDAIIQWAHANNQSQLKSDATVIKLGLNKLKKEEMLGTLSYSEAARESAKINYSLMNLLKVDLTPSNVIEPPIDRPPVVSSTANDKLKILMMTASPAGTAELNLKEEELSIRQKLHNHISRFILEVKKAVDKNQFTEYTETLKPNILHFSGHGEKGKAGGIILQNDQNNDKALIPLQGLDILFKYFTRTRKIDLRAVVLNACFSEDQAEVIAKYVPYVIGTTIEIEDSLAIAFSTGFYFLLFEENASIEDSFLSGRARAALNGADESHFVIFKDGKKIESFD